MCTNEGRPVGHVSLQGGGAHGGDAVEGVEGEAVHQHVVELHAPAPHKCVISLCSLMVARHFNAESMHSCMRSHALASAGCM